MKKKITVVALALSVMAIAALGSTLAWFTSEDSATNTFEIGEVEIKQYEMEPDGNGGYQEFTQGQMMLPIVKVDAPSTDANYIDKLVAIKNEGKNDAYVRTFIAVPAALADILHLDLNVADGWVQDTKVWGNQSVNYQYEVDGEAKTYSVAYKILSFTYNKALAKDEKTPDLLKGVYMDAKVDVKENAQGVKQFCTKEGNSYKFYDFDITKEIKVLVATQACQADGFENAKQAIDSAFGGFTPDFTKINQ